MKTLAQRVANSVNYYNSCKSGKMDEISELGEVSKLGELGEPGCFGDGSLGLGHWQNLANFMN